MGKAKARPAPGELVRRTPTRPVRREEVVGNVVGQESVTEAVRQQSVSEVVTDPSAPREPMARPPAEADPVTTHEPMTGVLTNQRLTAGVTDPAGVTASVMGQEAVTKAVTGQESVTKAVTGKESVATTPTGDQPVTEAVTDQPGTPPGGLLPRLLAELEQATEQEVNALRRRLLSPPEVALPERRRVPRRTYAFYLAEELGEAIKRKAKAEDVPPSEVAERILWQAKAAGWL